jgi:sec-independent protein translocase protein TatA
MQDWMIVLIIGVVVIFGASKLPQIARNMGKAQGEFKKGLREGVDSDEAAAAQAPPAVAPGTPPASPPTAPPGQHMPPAQPATDQPPADGGTPTA